MLMLVEVRKMGGASICGVLTPSKWIKEEFDTSRILKQRIIGNVAYLAYKLDNNDVIAIVIEFTRITHRGKTVELIGKDMDENMGPFYYRCPKNILELLTPTHNMYALRWRAENWKNYGVEIDWVSQLSGDDKKKYFFEQEEDKRRSDMDPDLIISVDDYHDDSVIVTTADNRQHIITRNSYNRVNLGAMRYENQRLLHLCEPVSLNKST